MANIKKIAPIVPITITDDEYVKLVSHISNLWEEARNNALHAQFKIIHYLCTEIRKIAHGYTKDQY